MLFSDVVNEVVALTKRPDKIVSIRQKVNSAISLYSLDNEFPNDYSELNLAINAQEYTQAFSKTTLTRFRKFKYIKYGGIKKYLTHISMNEEMSGCDFKDRYYEVGTNVNINLSRLVATLDIGYFSYPPTLVGSGTGPGSLNYYWLLEIAPNLIIEKAASLLFRSIGEEKDARLCAEAALELYRVLRKDIGGESNK